MSNLLDGIDTPTQQAFIEEVKGNAQRDASRFAVQSYWLGGTRSAVQVSETSPNFSNFRRAIGITPTLTVKTPVGAG